jgi:hypothetical protein
MDPVATAEEDKFAAAAFAEETAAAENTAAAAAADVKLIAANMESLGSTGIRSKSRTTGSIPVTLIRKDRTDDGHVEAGSVTQSFKGRSAFSFQNSADATKYETGARFLKRFKLTVKNNKNISFRSILDPQEMMPLPESHGCVLYACHARRGSGGSDCGPIHEQQRRRRRLQGAGTRGGAARVRNVFAAFEEKNI